MLRKLSLRDRLRQSTASLHKQIEDDVRIERALDSLDSYRAMLVGLLGLFEPYERALAQVDWRGSGIDMTARQRSAQLVADLADLGLSAAEIAAIPRHPAPAAFADVPSALGALYVLEGSTLGGLMIFRQARERLGVEADRRGRFFAGHGAQTSAMWRDLVAALEALEPTSERADRAVAAAVDTFEAFGAWLAAPAQA